MVRVHFAEREPVDYPTATETVVEASGALVVNETEIGQVTDRNTLQTVSVIRSRTWLATWGPGSRWTHAEPIEEEAEERPALEVAR